MNNKKQLQERWFFPENQSLYGQIIDFFKGNINIETIQKLTLIESKLDLRGFSFPKTANYGTQNNNFKYFIIDGIQLNQLDLSFCDFGNTVWVNCNFNNLIINSSNFQASQFKNCKIHNIKCINTDFSFGEFGENKGKSSGSITNSDFDKCKFNGSKFFFPKIEHCSFKNCQLKNIDFDGSRFKNCIFEGYVGPDVYFGCHSENAIKSFLYIFDRVNPQKIYNPMLNIDFSKSVFENVVFSEKLNLSSCLMP